MPISITIGGLLSAFFEVNFDVADAVERDESVRFGMSVERREAYLRGDDSLSDIVSTARRASPVRDSPV